MLILYLAIPLIGFGYHEMQKKKRGKEKRKTSHGVAALVLGLGGLLWLFYRHWDEAFALVDVKRTLGFALTGLILAFAGVLWMRGPKEKRKPGFGLLFLLGGLGCLAWAVWMNLGAVKTLFLG
jgi:hypothetical protein